MLQGASIFGRTLAPIADVARRLHIIRGKFFREYSGTCGGRVCRCQRFRSSGGYSEFWHEEGSWEWMAKTV